MSGEPEEPFSIEGAEVVVEDPLPDAPPGDDARMQPFVDPDLSLSPVIPLGFAGGDVVFAMPEGEIRQEKAVRIGQMLRTDLFACSAGQTFLTYWRNGKNEFQRELAAVWFVRKCRDAGIWDGSRPMRELGVWLGDDDSHILLHLGDELWRVGAKGPAEKLSIAQVLRARSPAGRRAPLYRLRPPAPRPEKPASVAQGQWARDQLDTWRFEPIGAEGLTGADVVAGWMAAALLGAVAPFRGHLMVHALQGAGKTTLMAFVQALLGALAGDVIDSYTEAGLKNDLAGNARPVLLDEAEGGTGVHGPGVVEKALELLRRMATGSGAHRKQGDIGGGTVTLTAVGACMIAGITPPRLGPADASRFVEIRLLPLKTPGLRPMASRHELEAALVKARAMAPGLLGRALKGAWRYRADVDTLTAAMMRGGESPRAADLVAMLAAGRRLLLFDKALSPEEADAEVAFWRPLLDQREASGSVSNTGAEALAHLMAGDSGLHLSNRRETVGGLIRRWVKHEREYDDLLLGMGLKLSDDMSPDGRPGPWLLVANQHPRLEAAFKGTPWSDWKRVLSFLDGLGPEHQTWTTRSSIRFGVGVKQRAIAVPLAPWLEDGAVRSISVPNPVPPEEYDFSGDF